MPAVLPVSPGRGKIRDVSLATDEHHERFGTAAAPAY